LAEGHELIRLRREIVGHGVSRLVAALDPAPSRLTGVVVAPAGGVRGPARNGPIDAIRDLGVIGLTTPGVPAVPVSVRLLEAQQTRCWLLAADIHLVPGGEVRLVSRADVITLPASARDTARAVEYLHDAGLGEQWPGVLLFGEPQPADGDVAHALCAFTGAPSVPAVAAAPGGAES
jgi:hypothetical protein